MFKRMLKRTGPGARYYDLPIPPAVAKALHKEAGGELTLEIVQTDEGKQVLIVYNE